MSFIFVKLNSRVIDNKWNENLILLSKNQWNIFKLRCGFLTSGMTILRLKNKSNQIKTLSHSDNLQSEITEEWYYTVPLRNKKD